MNSFFTRKILALVLAIAAVLAVYVYTQISIKSQIKPTRVVVAKQDIPADTKITKDMVTYINMPGDAVPKKEKVVQDGKKVVGYYTAPGYGISKSSMVFESKIIEPKKRGDVGIQGLKPDEQTFSFQVDVPTTHGNAILPGHTVDLYTAFMYNDKDEKKPFFGRIAKQIKVLTVRDPQGSDIYSDDDFTRPAEGEEEKQSKRKLRPAVMTVAVDIDTLQFLSEAKMIGTIVPIASGLTKPDESVQKAIQKGDLSLDELTTGANIHDVPVTRGLVSKISLNPKGIVKEVAENAESNDSVDLESIKKEYEEELKEKTEKQKG
ncbi:MULTISPECIES: Flp pilus assembly protein CpaB [Pseudobacillus]|uniref:Flp pilus assembly protein CpaB n=1 Tax=Pseudobacillus TaxID=108525 RepID=UPI00387A4019